MKNVSVTCEFSFQVQGVGVNTPTWLSNLMSRISAVFPENFRGRLGKEFFFLCGKSSVSTGGNKMSPYMYFLIVL